MPTETSDTLAKRYILNKVRKAGRWIYSNLGAGLQAIGVGFITTSLQHRFFDESNSDDPFALAMGIAGGVTYVAGAVLEKAAKTENDPRCCNSSALIQRGLSTASGIAAVNSIANLATRTHTVSSNLGNLFSVPLLLSASGELNTNREPYKLRWEKLRFATLMTGDFLMFAGFRPILNGTHPQPYEIVFLCAGVSLNLAETIFSCRFDCAGQMRNIESQQRLNSALVRRGMKLNISVSTVTTVYDILIKNLSAYAIANDVFQGLVSVLFLLTLLRLRYLANHPEARPLLTDNTNAQAEDAALLALIRQRAEEEANNRGGDLQAAAEEEDNYSYSSSPA